jgi:hypothetical protein
MTSELTVSLAGVAETMPWTLHNRASEAAHPRGPGIAHVRLGTQDARHPESFDGASRGGADA